MKIFIERFYFLCFLISIPIAIISPMAVYGPYTVEGKMADIVVTLMFMVPVVFIVFSMLAKKSQKCSNSEIVMLVSFPVAYVLLVIVLYNFFI